MFALADCNNFYASCERLFRPELNARPVIVLSNNDGCVIARSNEAKALGIAMGAPKFKIEDEIKRHNIAVCSSHYELYGDMSARVMTNLARFTPEVEVYSIDECFLRLAGFTNLDQYGKNIRDTTIKNTGIPISVGIAPTKTLAKLANKLAKKTPSGVVLLDNEAEITEALKSYPVEDIWGVGRQYAIKLISEGIETAEQLRNLPAEWVNKNMTIVGARMWRELWGESCLHLKTVLDPKKGMCTSRAFGKVTDNFGDLEQATASYTSRLGVKLRREKLCTMVISVRLLTNRFKTDQLQAYPSITINLPHPVNNTTDLIRAAMTGLKKIYLKGFLYQKVEVMATGLIPETEVQLNMFEEYQGLKNNKLSGILDTINKHYGSGTIRMATAGQQQRWAMKRQFLSPGYTTNWKDIIKVK